MRRKLGAGLPESRRPWRPGRGDRDPHLTDEDASAIVRIRPDGTKRTVLDSRTPIYEVSGTHRTQVAGLRSPEGLALDEEGRLYVAEDVPGGRLLVFDIRGPIRRSRMEGEVVRLPLQNSRFAWESIAIGPKGELLLAGSSLEDVTGTDGRGDLFMGVILHRDASGDWWLLLNHAMTSYSGVCFSPDGRYALMTAESPGLVGCVDLRTRMVRTFLWDMTFHSPEGVCSLPGGAFLVAEESGKIFRMDPTSGGVQLVYEHDGTVESVLWDAAGRRLLLTDDRHGQLVAVPLNRGEHLCCAAGRSTISRSSRKPRHGAPAVSRIPRGGASRAVADPGSGAKAWTPAARRCWATPGAGRRRSST